LKQAGVYVTEDFSSKKVINKGGKLVPGSPIKTNQVFFLLFAVDHITVSCAFCMGPFKKAPPLPPPPS